MKFSVVYSLVSVLTLLPPVQSFYTFHQSSVIPWGTERQVVTAAQSMLRSQKDDFMASLHERVSQVNENESQLPLVVLDCMLPRQSLSLTVRNPLLMELVRTRLESETPSFGVLGKAKLRSGQLVHLKNGVEVEIEHARVSKDGLELKLKANRLFRIPDQSSVSRTKQGWTKAFVEFVDLEQEDKEQETFKAVIAMQRARELTHPNAAMNESLSLVDMWIKLAREKERSKGQIDQLLQDLGPMPSWKRPSDCAFWVGALINPIPALGVALEIRPKLLLAKSADERTQIALDGIWNSIQHMEGADKRYRKIKE